MIESEHHYDSFVDYRKHRMKMEARGWKCGKVTGHSVKNGLFGRFLRDEYRMKIVAIYYRNKPEKKDDCREEIR